ncbi:MAG: YCF48-related protein, partial [Ignavibacteriaceae bacterium]|nr:YCF48-related protein [Ignavibacteriaceae bacterium]
TNDGGLTWDSVGYTNNQNAVRWASFADENVGIVGTNNYYHWKTTNGGTTWNAITFPKGGMVEGGITCLDSITYIAPDGGNNIISKTTDGGKTWTTFSPSWNNFGAAQHLRMLNKNWGLMVGNSFIYKTRDAGSTWENVPVSSDLASGYYDVAIQDTSNYVVSGPAGFLMRTKNGGATWSRMQSGTLGDLANICLVSNDTLLIGSWQNYSSMNVMKIPLNTFIATASLKIKQPLGGEIFKIGTSLPIIWTSNIVDYIKIDFSTDNGISWTTIAAHDSAPLGYQPWTIPNTPSLHCFIRITDVSNPALHDSTSAFTIDVPPTSFWIPANSGTSEGIWGVDYSSPNVAWICASTGDIRKSTDGGMNFTSVGKIADVTYSIAALTDQVALVASSPSSGDGIIYKTIDGGHTWNQVYTAVGAWFDFISKIDANNLWALSDPVNGKYLIVKSSDAGNTWTVAANLPDAPSGFYGAIGGYDQIDNTFWFGVGGLAGVYTTNHIYKSSNYADGPWTVTTTTQPSPGALSFSSAKGNGIAAFWNLQYKIDRSTDGGNTWAETLTLTGQPHTVGYIRGTSTAYLASSDGNVYRTSDDGATWSPEPLPVGIGGEPFFIRLSSDGSNGLIGGNTGYILKKVNATSLSPLTVILPNGGEQLNATSNYTIKWYCYSSQITNVKLEYTTNNGTTWLLIVASVPANQVTYAWSVPSTLTQTAKVRVSDVATGLISDMSDNVFLISPVSGIKDNNIVTNYELSQNYPNPFNPSTTIRYAIKNDGNVTLKVFDILGREVAVIVHEYQKEGNYNIKFDAHKLSSGIYLYRIESGNFTDTKKFILLK